MSRSDVGIKASRGERRGTRARRREFRFERIEAWQLDRQFNRQVYAISRKFALLPQIRRASTSVGSSIAAPPRRLPAGRLRDQRATGMFQRVSIPCGLERKILSKQKSAADFRGGGA